MRFNATLALAVLLAATMVASAVEIPVIITEPAGIARSGEPVSGGIPLPAGQFKPGDGAKFALSDEDGKPVPVQVSETVVDHRGDLRWILLDYQLELPANGTRKLTLKSGQRPAAPAAPLKVTQAADAVKVDTGKVAFTVSKSQPFGLFSEATANGQQVLTGGEVSYTDATSGKTCRAGRPDVVRLDYNGPLRVTIEVRGRFADDLNKAFYCTYITAWAGRSDVEVVHSVINSRSDTQHYILLGGSRIVLHGPAGDRPVVREGGDWLQVGRVAAADRLFRTDPPRLLSATDGNLVLDAAPPRSSLPANLRGFRSASVRGENRWLFDCSHHRSEYRIDLSAGDDEKAVATSAKAADSRVWGFAPGDWVSECQVLGVGRFGTLADEKAAYAKWGWTASNRDPSMRHNPTRFVAWEDNHYESESDSVEGLLLMFVRTGSRGYFDEAEGWARYHTDLQAWRTEGWAWTEGGIWWPQSRAFGGNRKARKEVRPLNAELWRIGMAKGCYCHFYGAGLADWYCLTGDRNALDALIDINEIKLNELEKYRFAGGGVALGSTRGFGRGWYVAERTWMVRPKDPTVAKLVKLCRQHFIALPAKLLDERGVYAPIQNNSPGKYLTPGIKEYMSENGITAAGDGTFKDSKGHTWKWRDMGGTWMLAYIQDAADLAAEQNGDEDLMDFSIAAGEFTAEYMLSPVAKQTWYYTALDIPRRGDIWDNWKYDGLKRNADGEGPKHSGWYTRFFPDACARAYSWTGEEHLMDRGKALWSYGDRRGYQTAALTKTYPYANHHPSKDDSTMSTARLLYWAAHPRADAAPPAAVTDLAVSVSGGKAKVTFTAPADAGGGKVARYQLKCSDKPLVDYATYIAKLRAFEEGSVRNWWRAANCRGEPAPGAGARVSFTVEAPQGAKFFAVRSFDDSDNRSAISNVAEVK